MIIINQVKRQTLILQKVMNVSLTNIKNN